VFAVGPFEEPPPEFDYEGTVEEDEDRGNGRPPILHQIHYRYASCLGTWAFAAADCVKVHTSGVVCSFGFDYDGTVEQDEDRRDGRPGYCTTGMNTLSH
jgi:hypothetical protein